MSSTYKEAEKRLRHGIPLRTDQITTLLEEGIDVGEMERRIEREQAAGIDLGLF